MFKNNADKVNLFLQYQLAHHKQDYAYIKRLYDTQALHILDFQIKNPNTLIASALFVGDVKNTVKFAEKIQDTSIIAQMILAIDYLQQHQTKKAFNMLEKSEERLAYAFMYLIAMYQKDADTLVKLRKKIPDIAPTLESLYTQKNLANLNGVVAQLLFNTYEIDIPMLQLARHLSPKNPSIQYALLIAYADAKADFMVAEMVPDLIITQKLNSILEHIYQDTNSPETKKIILDHIPPNSPYWHMSIASDMLVKHDYQQAEQHLLQANTQNTFDDDWTYWYRLGIAYERQKYIDKARKVLSHAVRKSNNNPQVVNYLAYTEILHDIDIKSNLSKLKHAYEQSPTAYIADSVGWAYYNVQQYEKAVYYLEKASETMPMNGVINDHLGDAYLALGRHREAIIHWKRALLDTEEKDLNRPLVQQKINSLK